MSEETCATFNDDNDDLNLGSNFHFDIPKEIIFPTELNHYLKERVQYLMHENGMLKKNLSESEFELQGSRNKIETLNAKIKRLDVGNEFAQVGNVARGKIVELSKKLREKSSELETAKSKCSKLEQEIVTINQRNMESHEVKEDKPVRPKNEMEQEIKLLNDKVNSLNGKLFEERNAITGLKNELKLAHKILQEEIGDTYENLQQISMKEGWKGRAQIISDMQHKNNELREKLKVFQEKENKNGDTVLQRRTLLEKKLEKSSKEIDIFKNDNEELKKKIEGMRMRHRNLEIESNLWKTKFTNLTEQMEKDRELITTLSNQNALNQNSQNDMLKKKDSNIEKLQKDLKEMKMDMKKERCKVESLEKSLNEKEVELEKFKESLKSSCKTSAEDYSKSDDRQVQKLNAERLRLVELTEMVSQRLQVAKVQLTNIENLYRYERQKAARLEAKVARMQLGDTTERSCGGYSTAFSKFGKADNLEFKLELAEETIKALQTKLNIEKKERELDLQDFSKIIKANRSDDDN